MFSGIFAGICWALGTVVLGIALGMSQFVTSEEAIILAPFVSTFLHDAVSAVFMWIYNAVRGSIKELFSLFKTKDFKWLVAASAIGGPIGMTGYVMAVNYMGASIGAVASAVYPAIGTALAALFLKERVRWYQWIFLVFTLFGVFGLSYSPGGIVSNFWLGLLGAFMCAFGWGIEAVILAKCLKNPKIKNEHVLAIRQTTSSLCYGALILPIISAWRFTAGLFNKESAGLILTVALAALCSSISYLFYYKAIAKLGASKAMALNITYTAWAIVFTVIIVRDLSVLTPKTILCALAVVVFGILAACDVKELFKRREK